MTIFNERSTRTETVDTGFVVRLPPRNVSIAVGRSILRRVVIFRNDDAASSYLVAFTEVLTNAIDEHVRIGNDQAIRMEVHIGSRDLVKIIDAGNGMSPQPDLTQPPDDPATERGRGLALASAFVPALTIETDATGTTVTLPVDGLGIIR